MRAPRSRKRPRPTDGLSDEQLALVLTTWEAMGEAPTHQAIRKVLHRTCAACKGTGAIPVPTDEPGRFGKATHLACAMCGGDGRAHVFMTTH